MDSDPILEENLGISQIGDWGKYQFRQHLLHLLGGFLAGLHMLSIVAVVPTPDHRCFISDLDGQSVSSPTFNVSELTGYIPTDRDGELDSCKKFGGPNGSEIIGCGQEFVYDTTYYHESRVMSWGMVCERKWERAMIQAIYIFGVLVGAIVLGPLSDKFGRKTVFYISGVLQVFAGLAAAFAWNYPSYVIVLFFYGAFASAGSYISGFCLTMELVGKSKRTLCGTAFSGAFAVGVMFVALWGYLITDVTILQIVYSLHSVSLFAHWWLIDESVRWLWGQGRTQEAIKIVQKAAIVNGKPFDNKFDGKAASMGPSGRSYGICDLFRTPVLRSRAINVAFNWFANSIVYYGLSLNAGKLKGNPFIVLFLMGLAEIPGYFIVIGFVDKTGRRCLCTTLMILGGLSCIIVAFIPQGTVGTAIVLFGKMFIAGSFAIIYNYTAELFPTVVRNSAVGIGAMAARFSGMLTPLLSLLDSLDKQLPTLIFGTFAILSAICTLFLPETLNKEMPQSVEEGEHFGIGDTGYRTCINFCRGRKDGMGITAPTKDTTDRENEKLNESE